MNGTVIDGGKVHLLTERAARCGVGHHARRGQWQIELGEVTCQRCLKLGRSKLETDLPANHTNHANDSATAAISGLVQRQGAELMSRRRSAEPPLRRDEP